MESLSEGKAAWEHGGMGAWGIPLPTLPPTLYLIFLVTRTNP